MGITAARNLKKQKTSNLWHNFLQRNNDLITLTNLTLRRGARVLLDSVSLTLNPAEKIGLIGKNGAGKSTLLKMLMGKEIADHGNIIINKDITHDGIDPSLEICFSCIFIFIV